jgi:putative peptide zinc metalloprotease protein
MNLSLIPPTIAAARLRPDLVVMPDGETGAGRILKDPISRKYFRFDEVEGFILDRIDGQRSALDIQIELATWLGEEFALEEVEEFIDSLRERGLVQAPGPLLPSRSPQLGQKILTALQQGGFNLRTADQPLPVGIVPARQNRAEAHKFDEGLRYLHEGRFHGALRAFDEILQQNPANHRAATIRSILLQAGTAEATKSVEQRMQPQRSKSSLYYQIPVFNPDALFTALEPKLRLIWTKGFLFLYLVLIANAAWIALSRWQVMVSQLPNISASSWGLGLVALGFGLVAVHECWHGLTCKHFGGRVNESGFLMIFFCIPAMYVDVSDAWIFRDKRHRVLVGLAGPMWDLAVVALGTVIWHVSPPGAVQSTAIIAVAVSLMSLLMNLNPLLKLDGYYIMSDLTGIPNLKDAASEAFSNLLRRLRGLPTQPVRFSVETRRLLVVYGLLSALYSILIFWLLGLFLFTVATRQVGLLGPVLMVGLIGWFARRPLSAMGLALRTKLEAMTSRRAIGLALSLIVVGSILVLPRSLRVAGPAALDGASRAPVRAEIAGNLAEILVKEGDLVSQGQVVARLEASDLQTQQASMRSSIEQARAQLAMLQRGTEPERLMQARESIRAAEAEVANLANRSSRLDRLRQDGLVSADLHEQAKTDLTIKQGELRAAVEESRLLRRGTAPERVAAAAAEVVRLETELKGIERRLAACELTAPIAGRVVTPKLISHHGDFLSTGEQLLEIVDTSELVVEIQVLESEIGEVREQLPVQLRFTAFPDRTFRGQVLEIAATATPDALGRAAFRVRASVENNDQLLKPGMTGAAKIEAGSRPLVALLVRRVLRLIDPSLL